MEADAITAGEVFNTTVIGPPPTNSSSSNLPSAGDRKAIEDTGPLMRVVVWMLVGVSGIFLALRIYCKFLKHRGLWWDDHVLVAAWLALAADAAVNTLNLSLGFGMHVSNIDPANLPYIGLLANLSSSLAILGAVWSKTSFGMTLLRITEGATKAAVWFIIVTMNLAMSISVLVTWIQCNPIPKGWEKTINGVCWDPRVNAYYGVFAAVYSGVMDIVLALLPWGIIWGLQMRTKEKIGIALAMSMGVFAGCAAFIKSTKIPLVLLEDFTYEGYDLVIWGAAEVAITICAASVPLLRVLVREVRNITQRRYGYHQHGTHGTHAHTVSESTSDKTTKPARTYASTSEERSSRKTFFSVSMPRKGSPPPVIVASGVPNASLQRSNSTVVVSAEKNDRQSRRFSQYNLSTRWKLLDMGNYPGLGGLGFDASNYSNHNSGGGDKDLEAGLGSSETRRMSSGRILQTQEVTVQYRRRDEGDDGGGNDDDNTKRITRSMGPDAVDSRGVRGMEGMGGMV